MDLEGIYRKSGGSGQTNLIRDGFESDPNYDISDPDLDINAVCSALKQYLRKLPTPLITYPVYDKLLDCFQHSPSPTHPSQANSSAHSPSPPLDGVRAAIADLPAAHWRTLQFLMFHLDRVAARQAVNKMTPYNIGTVFAPTVMRTLDREQEAVDTKVKIRAMEYLVENCHAVMMG
jgi:hypothetical protein